MKVNDGLKVTAFTAIALAVWASAGSADASAVTMGNAPISPADIQTSGENQKVYIDVSKLDKEEVMFIDIVVYGKQAETMGMYVTKGTPLLVEGRLSFRQWEQEGQKRSKHEVIVESFQMVGGRKDRTDFDESMVDKDDLKMPADDSMIRDEDVPF